MVIASIAEVGRRVKGFGTGFSFRSNTTFCWERGRPVRTEREARMNYLVVGSGTV